MTKKIKQFSQKHKWFVFGILPILLIGITVSIAFAASFNDAASGNWDIGTTWGGGCGSSCTEGTDYPGAADIATIDSHTVTLTGTQAVDDITIASGGTFVGGSFWFEVHGGWSNTGGTFTANSSTVIFASTQGTENIDSGSDAFNDVAINDGLVGYWKLDETTSPAIDYSGYTNNGVWTNSPTASTTTSSTINFNNPRSLSFDGADDFVNVGNPEILNDLGPMTLSAWIFPVTSGEGSRGYILCKNFSSASNDGRWQLYISDSSESLAFKFNKEGSTDLTRTAADNSVSLGSWQHVVLTWDGSTTAANVHIYKNGVELSYQTTTDGVSFNSDVSLDVIIGNRGNATRTFDGLIDEVSK